MKYRKAMKYRVYLQRVRMRRPKAYWTARWSYGKLIMYRLVMNTGPNKRAVAMWRRRKMRWFV